MVANGPVRYSTVIKHVMNDTETREYYMDRMLATGSKPAWVLMSNLEGDTYEK